MSRVLVTADDCTGALEVAGELADRLGRPVPALVGFRSVRATSGTAADSAMLVVDLGSRHLEASRAATGLVDVVERLRPEVAAHKIDSTLRGNWAHELVEVGRALDRPVLVVPALPGAGRLCQHGVVVVDGVPVAATVAGRDPRHPVRWSRPAEHLLAAGAGEVVEVGTDAELAAWLARPEPTVAVADAASSADLDRIGARWRSADRQVVLAGTAASVAAGLSGRADAAAVAHRRPVAEAVLVVCGSLHPVARRQVAELVMHADEGDRVAVVTSSPPWPPDVGVTDADAVAVAAALADRARRAVVAHPGRALLVLGGDTASALLDGERLDVHGCVEPGVPWSLRADDGRLVVTRSGGFGDPAGLRRLVERLLAGV